jgi:hypothetical protein
MSGDSNGEPFVGKVTQKTLLFGPDGNVLLTHSGDQWEPPGGTFEYGETLVGGLRRELGEGDEEDSARSDRPSKSKRLSKALG